jgi:uncharacterized protein YkwD
MSKWFMNQPMGRKFVSTSLRLTCSLVVGLNLCGLSLSLFPAAAVQASPQMPPPATAIQATAGITLFLPILFSSPTVEEQLLNLINAERSTRGLAPLDADNLLRQVAEAHSQDMVNRRFFSHTNPDGLDPAERLEQAGYEAIAWGETLGAGYTSATAMFNGWISSSSHTAILFSPDYTEIGLGYVAGGPYGHYWTAILATPAN